LDQPDAGLRELVPDADRDLLPPDAGSASSSGVVEVDVDVDFDLNLNVDWDVPR
jgi:hypothetical protein